MEKLAPSRLDLLLQEFFLPNNLIVGYGNADRQDDGVAWHVLCQIAQKLGMDLPAFPEDGFFPEGNETDLWFVLQLAPEMSEDFAHYERICFVDAHTGNIADDILLQPVEDSPASSAFTHHLTPAACLSLTRTIFQAQPQAQLLSVRGHHFEFSRELSPETAVLVEKAVDILWQWIEQSKSGMEDE